MELDAENEEAAAVYLDSRSQIWTVDLGQRGRLITLDIPAVKAVMDIYGVNDQVRTLRSVLRVFHTVESQRGQS